MNAVDLILQDKMIHDEQEMNKTLSDVIIKQRVFEEVIVERVKLIQNQLHITKQIAKRGGNLVGGADPVTLKKHILKIKEELKEDIIFQSQQIKEELKDEIAKELAIVLGNEMASEIQKFQHKIDQSRQSENTTLISPRPQSPDKQLIRQLQSQI